MDIVEAAKKLTGVNWNLRGDKIEQADDGSKRVTPPTMEEINDLLSTVAYKDLRAKEYPAIADQLDAVWKGGTEMESMRAKVMAVKAKYPEPEK